MQSLVTKCAAKEANENAQSLPDAVSSTAAAADVPPSSSSSDAMILRLKELRGWVGADAGEDTGCFRSGERYEGTNRSNEMLAELPALASADGPLRLDITAPVFWRSTLHLQLAPRAPTERGKGYQSVTFRCL